MLSIIFSIGVLICEVILLIYYYKLLISLRKSVVSIDKNIKEIKDGKLND